MEGIALNLKLNGPCPKCGQPPLIGGKQGNIYLDEVKKVMSIKCQNCSTMLDLKLTEEKYDELYKELKPYRMAIN